MGGSPCVFCHRELNALFFLNAIVSLSQLFLRHRGDQHHGPGVLPAGERGPQDPPVQRGPGAAQPAALPANLL